jgi:hypothetical protein
MEDNVDEEENNDISDKISQYLANDDIIVKKKKEKSDFLKNLKEIMKPLTERKEKLEKRIIEYYDKKKIDELEVNVKGKPNGKLIKHETTRKKPIKLELIQDCILDSIGKKIINNESIVLNKEQLVEIVNNIIDEIEVNREVTRKVELKHKNPRKPRVKMADF